jgi:hypothetical protein
VQKPKQVFLKLKLRAAWICRVKTVCGSIFYSLCKEMEVVFLNFCYIRLVEDIRKDVKRVI